MTYEIEAAEQHSAADQLMVAELTIGD